MAHWFLANSFFKYNQFDSAVEHITIANILNRNNQFILEDMKFIYRKSNKDFNEWKFSPQCEFYRAKDSSEYYIATDTNWFIYGLAKAAWNFEPGYIYTLKINSDPKGVNQDFECLYLLADYLKEKSKNSLKMYDDFPDLKKLLEASKNNYRDEYIMYDVVLPRLPGMIYMMSPSSINAVKSYVTKIRYND